MTSIVEITQISRTNRPTRTEMESISEKLVLELAELLRIDLSLFRRHIVDGESFAFAFCL